LEYITADDKIESKPSKKGNKANNNTTNNKIKNSNNSNSTAKLNQNNNNIQKNQVNEHYDKEFELFKLNIEKETILSMNINKIKPNLNKNWLKII
jgi:hypothetical protein